MSYFTDVSVNEEDITLYKVDAVFERLQKYQEKRGVSLKSFYYYYQIVDEHIFITTTDFIPPEHRTFCITLNNFFGYLWSDDMVAKLFAFLFRPDIASRPFAIEEIGKV